MKRTLTSPLNATLIHGTTGAETEDCTLEPGTVYHVEDSDAPRTARTCIIVDGYRYETDNRELDAATEETK